MTTSQTGQSICAHSPRPRGRRNREGYGPLIVCLLCAVAVAPLLRGQSPCTHDGRLHYFRVAAMRYALDQGILFSRWMPDLAFGYGFPFFNYRAPLSYYMTLGLHLTGLSLPRALNLVYVLSMLGAALGAYLLARDLFGPYAGLMAGVAYAYAPYQLLDALVRGNAPETVALALMPFVLWAFRRLALQGGRRWLLASVALLAALYLGHNISSLLFTPFLLIYLILLWSVYRGQGAWRPVALAFVLALGLTAFFWFPALAEKGHVQLYLTGATRGNDFHHNFLNLPQIFASPRPFDTSLMNPPLSVRLGVVQPLLAGLGLVLGLILFGYGGINAIPWKRGRRRTPLGLAVSMERRRLDGLRANATSRPASPLAPMRPVARHPRSWSGRKAEEQWMSLLLFAWFAALCVFMATPSSLWLWEHVPLLPFVQFPWRLVGRASLPVALLVGAVWLLFPKGATPDLRSDSRADLGNICVSCVLGLLPSALIVTLVLAAMPSTYPPRGYCPMESHPTIRDVHRYEGRSGLVGVDPVGAYFPVWVQQRPQGSSLEAQYDGGGTVARFDASVLPQQAQVLEADYGPNRARIVVESPVRFRARYLSFYFPGWRAWVDGERVEVTPSDPHGLLTFEVPAGRHVVTVRFGETPLRLAADAFSMLALLVLVISIIPKKGARSPVSGRPSLAQQHPRSPWPTGLRLDTGSLRVVGLLLIVVLLPLFRLVETPFRRPNLRDDGTLPGVAHPLGQPYADGLTLIGYDQATDGHSRPLPADGTLRVDLYWTVRHQPSRRYQSVIHLVGPEGLRWSPTDSYRPADYQGAPPTTAWRPGRYAIDSHEVEPLPGTPPGRYDVVLTVFDRDTLQPLSMLNQEGNPAAPELTLGQLTLTRPRRPVALPEDERLDLPLTPFLSLLTADFDREEAAPGDNVYLTLMWQADDDFSYSTSSHCGQVLSLLSSDGAPHSPEGRYEAATYQLPPPGFSWEEGDVWRSQHRLLLPATLGTGVYTWTVEWCSLSSYPIGELSVEAPDRAFSPPPVGEGPRYGAPSYGAPSYGAPSSRRPSPSPMYIEIDARLGSVATLVGADLNPETRSLEPGANLAVTLVWRAEAETDTAYRVFLHLIGPDGALIAQSDAVPAEWTRPTTGWLPNEYIVDAHRLTIPSDAPEGTYTLQAGLYDPEGGRLTTPDGAESILLTMIAVDLLE